jgi:hypothetical protein
MVWSVVWLLACFSGIVWVWFLSLVRTVNKPLSWSNTGRIAPGQPAAAANNASVPLPSIPNRPRSPKNDANSSFVTCKNEQVSGASVGSWDAVPTPSMLYSKKNRGIASCRGRCSPCATRGLYRTRRNGDVRGKQTTSDMVVACRLLQNGANPLVFYRAAGHGNRVADVAGHSPRLSSQEGLHGRLCGLSQHRSCRTASRLRERQWAEEPCGGCQPHFAPSCPLPCPSQFDLCQKPALALAATPLLYPLPKPTNQTARGDAITMRKITLPLPKNSFALFKTLNSKDLRIRILREGKMIDYVIKSQKKTFKQPIRCSVGFKGKIVCL